MSAASDILVNIRKNTGTWFIRSLLVQKKDTPHSNVVVHIYRYALILCVVMLQDGQDRGFLDDLSVFCCQHPIYKDVGYRCAENISFQRAPPTGIFKL
ncbi:MAG: hypothetical protein LMBGKNDO_01271 [Bacteroidales bacterium]|nr:hypothetical protein [Bacteroidales bacterium]OQC56607.1 MAG: hypothetical protein BWX52_01585 [Bacteroidetes bacterium ADurb.Bin013]